MMLRRLIFILSLAICFISCGPSKYTMHLEMRQPSKSGLDLAAKNVSIVYLENGRSMNDGFNSSMADGLAYEIEEDYGTGEGSVGVYRMKRDNSGDYSSKDTLMNLLIDTGSDIVFLLDTVKFGEMTVGGPSKVAYSSVKDSSYINTGSIPFTVRIYSFDAMDKEETVKTFGGTAVAQSSVYSDGTFSMDRLREMAYIALPAEGRDAGELIAESFKSQWKTEAFSITYFDSAKWIDALEKADRFEWKEAMDVWFDLLKSSDPLKRSCASYNIAVACYMAGDYRLASDWLDLSDKESELPLSAALRKRIQAHL